MSKPKILIQLDSDPHASVFDAVVAVDAGVDHLLQYHQVTLETVRDLVHGAMFTRGPDDLRSTAIFIGGAQVSQGEALLKKVKSCFFGPMRVSVMLDANGANTTAAAAVLAAAKHLNLGQIRATVLAGTGPVGQRAARLLAQAGAEVRVASRSLAKAEEVVEQLRQRLPTGKLQAVETSNSTQASAALSDVQLVIAAGAAGIELVSCDVRKACSTLQVAIDLNAVPPLGIAGVETMDKGVLRDGVACYGAIGVGGTKMKIHKAALQQLFIANNLVLDAEEIFAIGQSL
ncbi:MAG: NADP-dependent methylenetetrahydromethanopterin/methylenetetrahydrofolate dehydrogenase [Planctomycetota bacterium]